MDELKRAELKRSGKWGPHPKSPVDRTPTRRSVRRKFKQQAKAVLREQEEISP